MLASINIFRDLPPEVLRALSQRCRWSRYRSNQTVVQGQDESRDVFFVARGRVCAIHYSPCGHEVRFSELPQGEMFGEFAAIDGGPRSTDVVTISQALLVSMSAELFWDVLRNHPTVCEAVLRRLTRIVRAISQRVIEFSTLPVRSRIHAELLRLARASTPDHGRGCAVIFPAPTHAIIATSVSTHREAVTRALNELASAGVIERKGGALVIKDISALSKMLRARLEDRHPGLQVAGMPVRQPLVGAGTDSVAATRRAPRASIDPTALGRQK